MSFTPEELTAAEDAFRLHRDGKCPDDCGFCYDLLLAKEPRFDRELKRIADLKAFNRVKAARPTLGKPKGSAPILVPRQKVSKAEKRELREKQYKKRRR
jgi:hypothetical protein